MMIGAACYVHSWNLSKVVVLQFPSASTKKDYSYVFILLDHP